MKGPSRTKPHRWFIHWAASLMVLLSLGILMASLMLMRQGYVVRQGIVTGSSMEPCLRGPRLVWTCPSCSNEQEFAWDSCKSLRPFCCQFCGKTDATSGLDLVDAGHEVQMRAGERVRYAPLRFFRSMRSEEIANGMVHFSGLQRGDVVVFQEGPNSPKEIKRIVGFPGEQLAIHSGDLFVDGERYCKTLSQALSQSILVESWDRTNSQDMLEADANHRRKLSFSTRSSSFVDNRLARNAHDSHSIVPASDFGIAIQFANASQNESWTIQCALNSPAHHASIGITYSSMVITTPATRNSPAHHASIGITSSPGSIMIDSNDSTIVVPVQQNSDESRWLVIAIVDCFLLIGDADSEWLRTPLALLDVTSTASDWNDQAVIDIECQRGAISLEQALLFRDIVYRGQNDSASQTWETEDGIVLLGDNVSTSSDSRDRWSVRPSLSAIKGIVIQPDNPIELLVQQRSATGSKL